MRILVLSDLHLEVHPFVPAEARADLVILAGDIHNGIAGVEWAMRTFSVPVLYVAGNHEYYDGEFHSVRTAMASAAAGSPVRLLDCGEHRVGGVRFLGCTLWTDYSLAPEPERRAVIEEARLKNPDYTAIHHGERRLAPEDSIAMCRRHRDWLERKLAEPFPGSTAVVTHFAPHPRSIAAAYAGHPANPGFVVDLDAIMGRAALWIHGHTHTVFDYRVRGTRVLCNPRGYPGEATGFRDALVVDV